MSSLFAQSVDLPSICTDRAKAIRIQANHDGNSVSQVAQSAYLQTLRELRNQTNDPDSLIFKNSRACASNPVYCPLIFSKADTFHLRLFCDREIFNRILVTEDQKAAQTLRKCKFSRELFYTYPYEQDLSFQNDCLLPSNEVSNALGDASRIKRAEDTMASIRTQYIQTLGAIEAELNASHFKEAFAYAIYKVQEIMGYGSVAPDQIQSIQKLSRFALSILNPIGKRYGDPRVQHSANQARQVYEAIFKEFSNGQYGATFPALSKETQAYLNAIDDTQSKALYNPDTLIAQSTTMVSQTSGLYAFANVDVQALEKDRAYYDLFHGFLPYQFIRASIAKLLIIIQKKKYKHIQAFLTQKDRFVAWADRDIVCRQHQHTFCLSSKVPGLTKTEKDRRQNIENLRHEFLGKFWSDIKNGTFKLTYNPEVSTKDERDYIYTESFVREFNQKSKDLNDFCWAHAVPQDTYEKQIKSSQAFSTLLPLLQVKINTFLKIPRIGYLLKEETITKALDFPINFGEDLIRKCLTKGAVVGPIEPKTKTEMPPSTYGPYRTTTVLERPYKHPKDMYVRSTFSLSLQDLHHLETLILKDLGKELWSYNQWFFWRSHQDITNLLVQSVSKYFLSLVDYALSKPSAYLGHALMELLFEKDALEQRFTTRQYYLHGAALLISVVLIPFTVFSIPAMIASLCSFDLIMTAQGIKIKHLEGAQAEINTAARTFNITVEASIALHAYFRPQIDDIKVSRQLEAVLFIPLNAFAIAKGSWRLMRILVADQKLIATARTFKYEALLAKLAPSQKAILSLPSVENALLNLSTDSEIVEETLRLAKELDPEQLSQYINNALKLDIDVPTPPKPKAIPTKLIQPISSTRKAAISIQNGFLRLLSKFKGNTVIVAVAGTLQKLCSKHCQLYFSQTIDDLLEKGQITMDDALQILKGTNYIVEDGRVIPKILKLVEEDFFKFLSSNVAHKPELIQSFKQMFYGADLGDAETWQRLLSNLVAKGIRFDHQEDLKNFLKCLKFLNLEHTNLWKYMVKGAFTRQIHHRIDFIVDHIDDYMKIAAYDRHKTYIQFYDWVEAFINDPIKNKSNYTFREIAQWIKKDIDTDFDLSVIQKNIAKYRQVVNDQKETIERLTNGARHNQLSEFHKWIQKSTGDFRKAFDRTMKQTGDFKDAYKNAHQFVESTQWIDRDCFLRYGEAQGKTAKTFKNFTKYAAWGSATLTYMWNNLDEYDSEKVFDMEFLSRALYNIVISQASSTSKAMPSNHNGIGFLNKNIDVWRAGLPMATIDLFAYPVLDHYIWDPTSEAEAEISAQMLQAENVEDRLFEIFAKYPNVKQAIDEKLRKWQELYKRYQPYDTAKVDEDTEEEIYQQFLNNGLIQEFKDDADYENTIIESLKDVQYYEMYHNMRARKKYEDQAQIIDGNFDSPRLSIQTKSMANLGAFNESLDRYVILRSLDMVGDGPLNIWRTHYVTNTICKYRHTKSMGIVKALGYYTLFKLLIDNVKNAALANMTQTTGG
ncbi:MAG: hypothetical protein KDD48_00095 [Bdellovibrionales bacterium]|nr:hypothetical protein [Bdellovibrionales bacterium]